MSASEAPRGWAKVTLGDICNFQAGNGFPTEMQGRSGQEYPFYKVRDVSIAWSAGSRFLLGTEHSLSESEAASIRAKPVPVGTVVFAKIGEALRLNRRALTTTPSLIDNNMMGMWADPELVDPLYLYLYSTITKFDTEARASVVPSIRKSDVSSLLFPLPPRAEQTRIVEKLEELLSELDAGIAELKAAQRKLAQYRQSLLKAAVEGALTADWRAARGEPEETGAELLQRILAERRARWEQKQLSKFAEQGKPPPNEWRAKYPEPVTSNMTDLPQLPGGWAWATVDQCAIDEDGITDGPFGSNLKSEHYTESGPRVIRLQNIGDGRFQDARAHISVKHYEKLKKHAVVDGDVVVAMLGEILPRACSVPAGIAPAIVKADCARVRINAALVRADFLVVALNSEPTRKQVERLIKGVGRPRINLGNIRSIPVPLPPKSEQLHILSMLSESLESCDVQRSAIEMGFSLSAAQRKNILKAAFAGQLVPQDPSDEPAGALLARVRAKRETYEKRPKGRKQKQQKEIAVVRKLIDVLAEADDWMPAQELFRRCGVADGAQTDQVEALYAELRSLEKAGRLAVEAVADSEGRKLYDRLKLQAA